MRRFPLSRCVAVLVSAAVLFLTPGVGAYEAAAQVLRSAPVTGTPVVAVSPVAVPSAPRGLTAPGLAPSLPSASTLPSLPAVSLPVAVRPASAASAAASAAAPAAAARALTPAAAPAARPAAAPSAAPLAAAEAAPAALPAMRPVAEALRPASAPQARRGAVAASLSTLFDGLKARAGLSAEAPAASILGTGSVRPALNAARDTAPAASPEVPTPAPAPAPAAEARRPYLLSLSLASAGAAAAYFLLPVVVPMALALPLVSSVPVLAVKAGLVAAGFGLGASLAEGELWKSFPGAVAEGAVDAGRTAFRFWARFGLVFRAVLTAASVDEAMKTELPGLFWRYPVLAWPAVLVGYVFAPVVFLLGGVFKAVEIPARAAWRGLRRIVVGLLPFMADVFAFLAKAVRRFIPAMGAFLYRGGRMAAITAAGGAVTMAGATWNSLVKGPYAMERAWDAKLWQIPGAVAMLLGRLVGLVASVFLGAAGGLLGFVVGLPLTVAEAVIAFAAKVAPEGAAARVDGRWTRALERSAELAAFHRVGAAAGRDQATLPRALARLAAAAPGALYALPFVVLGTLGLFAVGVAAAFGYERPAPAASAPAERPWAPREEPPAQDEDYTGSPWGPLAGAVLGGLAGALYNGLIFVVVPLPLIPAAVFSPVIVLAVGVILGAGLGLALSQPKAWLGGLSGAWRQAKLAAGDDARLWARLGLASRVTLTGKPVDEALFDEAPLAATRYPALAWPGVVLGYPAALVGGLVAGAASLAGVPVKAAWKGLVILLTSGLIRRILRGLRKVLVHGLPFVFGFLVGAVVTEFRVAFGAALAAGLPVARGVIGAEGENRYRYTGLTGLVLKRLVQALGGLGALAAGVFGLAVGAVTLAPFALMSGLQRGLTWADAENRFTRWLWRFEKDFQNDLADASGRRLAMLEHPGAREESGLWQGVVRAANGLLNALSGVLWGLPVAAGVFVRAARNASASDKAVDERWEETAPPRSDRARSEGFSATVAREAGDAWAQTNGFFAEAGDAFAWAVARAERGSVLSWGHRALGFVAAVPAALTAAVAGAAEVPGRAALAWVKELALKLLPFLERVWNLAVRIAKRVFPFLGGAVAGAFIGAIGSAAFGAVLLARPWFKYVFAEAYDTSSVGRFLGVSALRLVSALAGVFFGALGLVFGLLAALPYSVTFMVATAFDWGRIGGTSERFFSNWTNGSLAAEMRRLSKLTDSFEFSDKKEGRDLAPMDGWVRLGMVTAATFAAALAATVAGWVAYARSIRDAYRMTKEGRTPPPWDGPSGRVIGDSADRGSKVGRATGRWLGVLGGLAAAGAIAFGYLTAPTWLGTFGAGLGLLGLVVLSGPVGWLAGLLVGAVVGTLVGMLLWLDRLMRQSPTRG